MDEFVCTLCFQPGFLLVHPCLLVRRFGRDGLCGRAQVVAHMVEIQQVVALRPEPIFYLIGYPLRPITHGMGLSTSSYALDGELNVLIIRVSDEENFIRAKVGIFYTGIIAGCSCADDPTPGEEQNEYCEVQFRINKMTAETTVALLEK